MKAASEHPRTVITIAAAAIVLVLAGVAAGRALGGADTVRTGDAARRGLQREAPGPRQQLQTSQARGAELRGQPATLQLARARQSRQRALADQRFKRRRPTR